MNQNPAFEIAKTTAVSFYATAAGSIEVRLELDTIWLSQEQMADLFAEQKAAISKHLKNIYASGELERGATVSKMETVQPEGERQVARQRLETNARELEADSHGFVGWVSVSEAQQSMQ